MARDKTFDQGIQSAMVDGTFLFNIFSGIPTTNLDHSQLWDAQLVQLTQGAVNKR